MYIYIYIYHTTPSNALGDFLGGHRRRRAGCESIADFYFNVDVVAQQPLTKQTPANTHSMREATCAIGWRTMCLLLLSFLLNISRRCASCSVWVFVKGGAVGGGAVDGGSIM